MKKAYEVVVMPPVSIALYNYQHQRKHLCLEELNPNQVTYFPKYMRE